MLNLDLAFEVILEDADSLCNMTLKVRNLQTTSIAEPLEEGGNNGSSQTHEKRGNNLQLRGHKGRKVNFLLFLLSSSQISWKRLQKG